jgi:hypothetical protein
MAKKIKEEKDLVIEFDKDNRLVAGGHPMINELLARLSLLHYSKNSDYSRADEFFENFKMNEDADIPSWEAAFCRITDKYSRLRTVMKNKGNMKVDESLEETLRDLSLISLIMLILLRESTFSMEK